MAAVSTRASYDFDSTPFFLPDPTTASCTIKPVLRSGKWSGSSDSDDFEGYSARSSEESSEDDSEEQSEDEDDSRIGVSSADGIEGEVVTKGARAAGWGKEAAPNSNGRAVRSAVSADPFW